MFRALDAAFLIDGTDWERAMEGRFGAPLHRGPGRNTNERLHTRTGSLHRSLRRRKTGKTLQRLKLKLTSEGANYARLQQFGGEIKPVNAKYLTIPTDDNLKGSGDVRFPSARDVISEGGFFLATRRSLYIVKPKFGRGRSGGGGQTDLLFLFWLRKQVKIPPRLKFFETWHRADIESKREKRHAAALALAMRNVRRKRGR